MMKWHQILKYFILSFLLSGCNGCLNRFYQVHEERKDKYEDIIFNAPGIKCSELLEYTDKEPTTDTAYYEVLGYFNGLELGKNDRIVHFKKDPEEYYCVSIDKDPCDIVAVFNKRIDTNWIFAMDSINEVETSRIGTRFVQTILSKLDSSVTFRIGQANR